ncbi:hypothetical protein MHBO_005303 [Bonamia ostreae]|uniref:Uncharacterized protein n=1 Tax=Bonamia ostreae TaxID=126728 RepID=A0ABV2AKA9_9EUKA
MFASNKLFRKRLSTTALKTEKALIKKSSPKPVQNYHWVNLIKAEYWDRSNMKSARTAKNSDEFLHINHQKHSIMASSKNLSSFSIGGILLVLQIAAYLLGYRFVYRNIYANNGQKGFYNVSESKKAAL